jgi:hypothetical protein
MKKLGLIITAILLLNGMLFAQTSVTYNGLGLADNGNQTTTIVSNRSGRGTFTRGSGFVIRPELYRGFYGSFGYQFNPYIQSFISIGYGDGLSGAIGARAYTNDNNWAGMFDLRCSLTNFNVFGVSLVGGASYKDLDFGFGGTLYTSGGKYAVVPVISIGWNIRCYPHR